MAERFETPSLRKGRSFQCCVCGETFSLPRRAETHLVDDHNIAGKYIRHTPQ